MLRQNLPSTEIEREENSQAALLLRDAADIEALKVAYRAVVTASAHSVFAEKVLPGEAKQPSEPLLSAYQAAVTAFANSVFQSTGTPAFEATRLTSDAGAVLHPIHQPAITAQLEPSLEQSADMADASHEISEITPANADETQDVEPETAQETEIFNANLKTAESVSPTSAQAPRRRLKVALRREYGPDASSGSTEPIQPVAADQAGFRPAYRNAAPQVNEPIPATGETPVNTPVFENPEISETIQPTSVTIAPAGDNLPEAPLPAIAIVSAALSAQLTQVIQEVSFKIPVENPTGASVSEAPREPDIRTTVENPQPAIDPATKPAKRPAPRPHLSFYAFHEQSAWSIPLKKTALPDTTPVMSIEPAFRFEPVAEPTTPTITQAANPPVTDEKTSVPATSAETLPEIIEGIHAEGEPETELITDEVSEESLLEGLPPNPESWLVKALSRPKLVAGAAGFCILASALSAMLNYWWLNGNTSGAAGNVAEAVEPFGMLNVQEEEPARKERTTGQFQHLQQLQNHPDAGQNHSAPAKPERQGTLIAQARPSEQPRHTAPARFRSNVVEPTGRPDPFAPLLSETDGGSGIGESASTPAPVKKDILSELQYTGFIGDIAAKDKVAIIKIQDASAGVTRTLIKKVGETFTVDGERVMLQGISRHALSLSVSGRTRSLDLSPYMELTASSDAGGSTQQGGGSTVSSGRRNPANPALEEPGQ